MNKITTIGLDPLHDHHQFHLRLTYCMTRKKDGRVLHFYWSTACETCPIKHHCTTGKERRIKRWEHEDVLERVQERLENNPDNMCTRRQTAEHPFGTIKAWMRSDGAATIARGAEVLALGGNAIQLAWRRSTSAKRSCDRGRGAQDPFLCHGHVAAFAFFGDVPTSILYDSTKFAVAKILGDGTTMSDVMYDMSDADI